MVIDHSDSVALPRRILEFVQGYFIQLRLSPKKLTAQCQLYSVTVLMDGWMDG